MRRPTVVVLGMLSKMPVAGVVWQNVHYLLGFRRLGWEVVYVEAHGRTPTMLMESPDDDATARAVAYVDRVMRRFDLAGRWAFHALHEPDGGVHGLSERELARAYRDADLVLNLHGGTVPFPEVADRGRLVYLETDPCEVQAQLHAGDERVVEFLSPHVAFFTFGEAIGRSGCRLPTDTRFPFRPTRQPVVLDLWPEAGPPREEWTTVGNWRQPWRDLWVDGELYGWSKHSEFVKVLDAPARSGERFELALASYDDDDRELLERHGWAVVPATAVSGDPDRYRDYVSRSRGEFSVAKDQNVRLRSGWFSDRSATYLAAGRPVVAHDTGFGEALPTGEGLLPFSDLESAAEALARVRADYPLHVREARELAREWFASDRVLGDLLADLGLAPRPRLSLALAPVSRRPTKLAPETHDAALAAPLPEPREAPAREPALGVVVPTRDNLPFLRLCLESLLAAEDALDVVVVDNGSGDGTPAYLAALAARDARLRILRNDGNRGFAAACNQGLAAARGGILVLLNDDTIVPPGALSLLASHLDDPGVGLVGPVTNAAGNEAEVEARYRTLAGLLRFARRRARTHRGASSDLPVPTMFCAALRRDAWTRLGELDERFGLGFFEDDDYARRARAAGYRVMLAEDAFVHHFGGASFGRLVPTGEHGELFRASRRRFEEKWGVEWRPHARRPRAGDEELPERVRAAVREALPADVPVAVVSKGDERLLELDGRLALHFPLGEDGGWAGFYPADSAEAIAQLERLRACGARFVVFPAPAFWWLDHYGGLREHLERRGAVAADDTCRVYPLEAA